MGTESKKANPEMQWEQNLALANQAVNLAVKDLVEKRGIEIVGESDRRFINCLYKRKPKDLYKKVSEYFNENKQKLCFEFEEDGRDERVGKVRPTDLVIAGHFSSETLERFVVIDLKGTLFGKGGSYPRRHLRFEAWCRLYYIPDHGWFVHYVDIIMRHRTPTERILFISEYTKSGNLEEMKENDPKELCLFFESPQGGMWG